MRCGPPNGLTSSRPATPQWQTPSPGPLLKKALQAAPTASDIRLHYAHALFRSGDKRAARGQCEQLLAVEGFARRAEVESLLAKL